MITVRIPEHKVHAVRTKLMDEQRGTAPENVVRYSVLHHTFWVWESNIGGYWQKRSCSRNGKRREDFFGPSFRHLEFYVTASGDQGFHATHTTTQLKRSRERAERAAQFPDFLPQRTWSNGGLVGGTVTGCWSGSKLTEMAITCTNMTPLKLSILIWAAAHPKLPYMRHDGTISHTEVIAAIGELAYVGLVLRTVHGCALTDRGEVFVGHLLKQPLPVQTAPKWVMPAEGAATI